MTIKITRRGAKAFHLINEVTGDKYKVTRSMAPEIFVNGEISYTLDYIGTIHKAREWDEEVGRWFYPYADEFGVELVKEIFDTINKDGE